MLRHWIFPPTTESDWRREPRSRIARWFNNWLPQWLRALLGIHVETKVFLNSDDPPQQTIWVDKKFLSVIGLFFVMAGKIIYICAPYWSSIMAGLGTTLIGLSIYWLLQERK
jgi:uncharacterized protein YjeT (DUF2065 family)